MKPKSPTRLVTNAFLPATAAGVALEPERDSKYEQSADALPAEERERGSCRRARASSIENDEQVQVDEELREARVAVHVADRVQVDQRADAGDEQDHRDRQRVDEEADVDAEAAGRDPREAASLTCARSLGGERAQREEHDRPTRRTRAPSSRWRASPPSARRCACRTAASTTAPTSGQRGDQPDEVEQVPCGHAQPFSSVDVVGGGVGAGAGRWPR